MTMLVNANRRVTLVRWSGEVLLTLALVGSILVSAILSEVLPLHPILFLVTLPLMGAAIAAAATMLVLFYGTYPKIDTIVCQRELRPLRLGLGMALFYVIMYATAFGLLSVFEARGSIHTFVAIYLTAVLSAQLFLFEGKHPATASLLVGLVVGVPGALLVCLRFEDLPNVPYLLVFVFYTVWTVAVISHLLGDLSYGLFLAHHRYDLNAPEPTEAPTVYISGFSFREPARIPRYRLVLAAAIVLGAGWCLVRYFSVTAPFLNLVATVKASGGTINAPEADQQIQKNVLDARLQPQKDDPRQALPDRLRSSISSQADLLRTLFSDVNALFLPAWSSSYGETVAALPHLTSLRIGAYRDPVVDSDLAHFAGLTDLRSLCLEKLEVTGDGLKHLKPLERLIRLSFTCTRITDASLLPLAGLKSPLSRIHLSLNGTRLTDSDLEAIRPLVKLNSLDLSGTQITDAGLQQLRGLVELHSLYLTNTKTTDAGLEHLKGLPKLQYIACSGTKITEAAVKKTVRGRRVESNSNESSASPAAATP